MRKWMCIVFILFVFSVGLAGAEPLSSVEISIPDYEVTTIGNLDYVEIPGGEILLAEEGRPRVPYYIKSINYPKGYRVQDVTLRERSGLRTTTGLRLPIVILSPEPELPIEMKKGWYPEEDYNWRVWWNPDGSTTLTIVMYPFYYDPETTEVKFYKNYHFDIEYVVSNVAITELILDKDIYELGDEVKIDIRLNNSGGTQDIIVSVVIKRYGSDEVMDGLPLRKLTDLTGYASFSTNWKTGDAESGYYYADVTLTDNSGNVLDKATGGFSVEVRAPEEMPPEETPTRWPLIAGIVGAVVIIGIGLAVYIKRR